MSATLASPQVSASIQGNLSGGAAPAPATSNAAHAVAAALTVGASAGQVNKVYSAPFTVTTGTPLVLDLTTGLTDPLGNALVFSAVSAILISNDSLVVGQDFSHGGGTTPVYTAAANVVAANGGAFLMLNPTAQVTVDSTHKLLQITVAAGTGVAGKITIVGR